MDHHHHNGHRAGLVAAELAHHDVVDLPPLGAAAARAVVTPTSDNAHLAVGAVFKGQGKTDNPYCADYLAGDQPGARPHQRRDQLPGGAGAADGRVSNSPDGVGVSAPKFAMLAALAARNGITLIALADGSYLLCKERMSRALADLFAVASLLRNMGVSL